MLTFLKRWLKRICIGVGAFFLIIMAIGLVARLFENDDPKVPEKIILGINLDREFTETEPDNPFRLALEGSEPRLQDLLSTLERAASDPKVVGIIARVGSTQIPLAQVQEIGPAIEHFRAQGKFAYVFAYTLGDMGAAERSYALATYFDEIWLQPVGSVGLSGLLLESPFARDALAHLGIKGQFFQRQEYKSAMESFTQNSFSAPARENLNALLDDVWNQLTGIIAANRKFSPEEGKQLAGGGPYTAQEALEKKLIDHIGYMDELEKLAKEKAGTGSDLFGWIAYQHTRAEKQSKPDRKASKIALVTVEGMIMEETDERSADLSARDLAAAIKDATEHEDIKAILLRINSPGGSAVGSEIIRRALILAQQQGKPVIASMASIAGSGGYWIAMNADQIVALPATLTGSIGVVGGRFELSGLWDKTGLNWDSIARGQNAGLWRMAAGWTKAHEVRINALLDATYAEFLAGVTAGRKLPAEQVEKIARGRVYTGAQAKDIGLVDRLGGRKEAEKALRESLKLPDNAKLAFIPYPAPETPSDKILRLLERLGLAAHLWSDFILSGQALLAPLASLSASLPNGLMMKMEPTGF